MTGTLPAVSFIADGSGPLDGGHLLLSRDERDHLLAASPEAARFVRVFLGSTEIAISGGVFGLIMKILRQLTAYRHYMRKSKKLGNSVRMQGREQKLQ